MAKKKKGTLRIGTSNVELPFNKSKFPEAFKDKTRLSYYASLFNTVELNSTFYKLPLSKTFAKWTSEVPEDFRFTIKFWKEITHAKNLVIDPSKLARFVDASAQMGDARGCLLIQFPGKITLDFYNEVEHCLSLLSDSGWRLAVEFRHPSWHVQEAYELLNEFGATMVLHDQRKSANLDLNTSADFIYVRYHGPGGDYRGEYPEEFFAEQSVKIKAWIKEGKDVYVYFNNTIGNAFGNAQRLWEIT